ncbi:MAG: PQQ-dependent sugar dehydrogenase [Alphaproteobacteria bacterium]|nr:PQQ-dependent sugar dehydrogenase [Alphaproteobacteria bacterium]
MQGKSITAIAAILLTCAGCGEDSPSGLGTSYNPVTSTSTPATPVPPKPITGLAQSPAIATFEKPWAVKVMPDGNLLVTQRSATGAISVVTPQGVITVVTGLPDTVGVLDVKLATDFVFTRTIFFSCMVRDVSAPRVGRAASDPAQFPERMMLYRARLIAGANGTLTLSGLTEMFRQDPTIVAPVGSGEPGGRIEFSPDGRYLYLTSGDRQELDAAFLFDLSNNLGKMIRLRIDGTVPNDNPFFGTPGAKTEIWSLGHRNAYGLGFAPDGRLWSAEHGPKGGDELNIILPGRNYGWPAVSNGDNYDGSPIPDHAPGDGFDAPVISWTPVIAPAGMIFYRGNEYADWRGDILLTGLQSKGLVRVRVSGDTAQEVQRIDLGTRIRDIAEGLDGSLWIITDGAAGELRKLSPVF